MDYAKTTVEQIAGAILTEFGQHPPIAPSSVTGTLAPQSSWLTSFDVQGYAHQ